MSATEREQIRKVVEVFTMEISHRKPIEEIRYQKNEPFPPFHSKRIDKLVDFIAARLEGEEPGPRVVLRPDGDGRLVDDGGQVWMPEGEEVVAEVLMDDHAVEKLLEQGRPATVMLDGPTTYQMPDMSKFTLVRRREGK